MIVRDQHQIERRQRTQRHRNGLEAFRTREPRRRGAHAPDRVGQHAQAVHLEKQRRVSEPGDAQAAAGRLQPTRQRIERRERRGRYAPLPAAQQVAQPRHRNAWDPADPGRIGCRLRNRPSRQRGEACMRARRAPAGLRPIDLMTRKASMARPPASVHGRESFASAPARTRSSQRWVARCAAATMAHGKTRRNAGPRRVGRSRAAVRADYPEHLRYRRAAGEGARRHERRPAAPRGPEPQGRPARLHGGVADHGRGVDRPSICCAHSSASDPSIRRPFRGCRVC